MFRTVGPFGGIGMMEDNDWGMRATSQGFRIKYAPNARVTTPPCKSFAELARRWDRHIGHEFQALDRARFGLARWGARSIAVAPSSLIHLGRVMTTDRVSGFRQRTQAAACLVRIRLHRARRMLGLLMTQEIAPLVHGWNRD